MKSSELDHLELLAEVETWSTDLRRWSESPPDWRPARPVQELVRRLVNRAESLRIRLEAPLVVATLGGTGTGKSSLINALAGDEVTMAGRQRPTTRQPTLICHPDIVADQLGIDPSAVIVVRRALPNLKDLVLIDCPDPDTTEDATLPDSNLALVRRILPHCDVILVTATQQKYRDLRVTSELASAAAGARIVFVQTHADRDEDIRDDWREHLEGEYAPGEIFFIDSVAALAETRSGEAPRGEFGRLVELLTRELAGTAARRIRRANFLDLVRETLANCSRRLRDGMPPVVTLSAIVQNERQRLTAVLAAHLEADLLDHRRVWEHRLLTEVADRWGMSPFALVVRAYQSAGNLLAGAALWRVHSPAQLALWGAVEGTRRLRRLKNQRQVDLVGKYAASAWTPSDLEASALVVAGYAKGDAQVPFPDGRPNELARQATDAGRDFLAAASSQLTTLVQRLGARHAHWLTRWPYELATVVAVAFILYRFIKSFVVDWVMHELGMRTDPAEAVGVDFFVAAGAALLGWCGLLVWLFTARLRRGVRAEINALAGQWRNSPATAALFANTQEACRRIKEYVDEGDALRAQVDRLRGRLDEPAPRIGHRLAEAPLADS